MKRHFLIFVVAIIAIGMALSACTRSASGGPSDVPSAEATLPNPVSTQSQLMKDIIAGTQTAMAAPLDATPAEGEEVVDDGEEAVETDDTGTTPEPAATATPKPLPTSTQGPPPVVELEYNSNLCSTASDCEIVSNQTICCCILDYAKDQYVTVQVSNPFFPRNSEIKILMGPSSEYDFSKYVIAGTAKYEPVSGQGVYFKTTVNIPDSLRGTKEIVVRVNSTDPGIFGINLFSNQ